MTNRIAAHLRSRHVARVVYGAIIGLALVVALEHDPPRPGVVAATLIATAVAVGLAELYSELVGIATQSGMAVLRGQVADTAGDVAGVVVGVAFPAVFFLLATAGAMKEATAFAVAKWSGLAMIGFYGFCAARLAGARFHSALIQATAVALLGALLIVVKSLLPH